jgi:hypothetical protein
MIVDGASYLSLSKAPAVIQVPFIDVNATHLFYLVNVTTGNVPSNHQEIGYLMRVALGGGTPEQVASLAGGNDGSQPFAVIPGGLVYGEAPDGFENPGHLTRVSFQGGTAKMIAPTKGLARAVIADDKNVYFIDQEAIKTVPLDGGNPRILVDSVTFSLGMSNGQVLAMTKPGLIGIPSDGSPVAVLAANQSGLYPQGCSPAESVCWVSAMGSTSGTLMQKTPNSDPVVLAQSDALQEPHGMIFDGINFFISSGVPGGFLYRVPSAGGEPALVAASRGLTSLAMNDSCIYWGGEGIFSLSREAADAANGSGF